jgi:hypothetical protein
VRVSAEPPEYSDAIARLRGYPAGPWDEEPGSVAFVHAGYPCQIWRNPRQGYLCGYVGVPLDHPWASLDFDINEPQVHGGVTYFEPADATVALRAGAEDPFHCVDAEAVLRSTKPARWWIGFDCGHAGDLIPAVSALFRHPVVYRDVAFVRREVESLAHQAHLAEARRRG